MSKDQPYTLSKVPEVTLVFWIIKIFATTLGETGGDALSMSMNLGYLLSTGIFAVLFVAAVTVQVRAVKFHPIIYWPTIVATTTVGTTLADFADRSLGIGYAGGSIILLLMLLASLWVWKRTLGSIAVDSVSSPKSECFTGLRSCARKPWAPHWATGRRIPKGWAMAAVFYYLAAYWQP